MAPEIIPLNGWIKTKNLNGLKNISFKITDNLSGIKQLTGYINNRWVLFEWDPKNDRFTYEFDENLPNEGTFEVKIAAEDYCGNQNVFQASGIRKFLPASPNKQTNNY